jgi:hypothetical protein
VRKPTLPQLERHLFAAADWSIRKFVRTTRRYRTIKSRPATTPSPPPDRRAGFGCTPSRVAC